MTTNPRLFIYELHHESFVEAYHLAQFLGYTHQSSLRKQVLSDWKEHFCDADFVIIHDESTLRRYEREHEVRGFGRARPVKAQRGRMFFRRGAIEKIMKLTSKDVEPLSRALSSFPPPQGSVSSSQLPLSFESVSSSVIVSPSLKNRAVVSTDPSTDPSRSLEERRFEYQVLETLLQHLLEVQEPTLRELALQAAEAGLGRKLPEFRPQNKIAETENKKTPPLPAGALGPFPENGTFYKLREIGAAAGGYSSVYAGKAANNVAAKFGFTPTQIRFTKLPFNIIKEEPDTNGKLRKMFRFNGRFSNLIVSELRSNPEFRPMRERVLPGPSGWDDYASFPKLSRGPFED